MAVADQPNGPSSAFESPTFEKDVSIHVKENIGAASISPSGRDVVLAGKSGLLIIDLDSPYSPPRHILNRADWQVADVQWSPFAERADWIASTCNQKAIIYNLSMTHNASKAPVEHVLHAHTRAITDINFSAHHPDLLATCAVDSFVYTWDLRTASRTAGSFQFSNQEPSLQFADFEAGATQVKWNRKNDNIIASSHDRFLKVWDKRNGAIPLTTIDAHNTKIYGIDWHRADEHKILTCSLDHTIKLWDKVGIDNDIAEPCRVIRTDYPVWRARHTPFPNGILAMPEQGSSALNLYTHDAGGPEDDTNIAEPAYAFSAHEEDANVQEFLWRSRGSIDDGIDNREFQLVSWGTDQRLHLHTTSSKFLFGAVGFKKGAKVTENPSFTRKGAAYVSYRDDSTTQQAARKGLPVDGRQQKGNLSSLLQSAQAQDSMISQFFRQGGSKERSTMTASTVRMNVSRRVVNHIKWMEGVTVGERRVEANGKLERIPALPHDQYPWTIKSNLAAEISQVGKLYSKVNFEHVDVPGRSITVSFNGPWGEDETLEDRKGEKKLVFLRLIMKFPSNYPEVTEAINETGETVKQANPINIEFEKTTAAINTEALQKLRSDMLSIAEHYGSLGREALEAVVSYGVGERGLEESITIPGDAREGTDGADIGPTVEEESSSDEDEQDVTGGEIMNTSLANANVPRPIENTARFSFSGALVIARVPTSHNSQGTSSTPIRLLRQPPQGLAKNDIFETFGRLNTSQADEKIEGEPSPTASVGSWESLSSQSTSSDSDLDTSAPLGMFQPPSAWQKPTLRFQTKMSNPSSIGAVPPTKTKSAVSILRSSVEEFVPSKKCLAEEYRIFGEGPSVCEHNAEVARRHGYEDLADIWELCKLILHNEVPLDLLPQQHRREQVLVLARRALVRIKRKDSGLDLQFDEADPVTNPKLKGRVKWGKHAVVSWLIPEIFEHYQKLADTQMLAMLSCIFSEPAAHEGVTSTMSRMRKSHLPMSMEAPAFSLDYFPSAEAAWSLFKPSISIPSTPAHSRFATPVYEFGWSRFGKALDTYGSHNSSSGPWGSDTAPSDPVTPYSTGNTPPHVSRAPTFRSATTVNTPYSTSPEQPHPIKRASTTNFASAIATLSKPFSNALAASPPVKPRIEGDLSTSAPTSGVTWGTTTFFSSGSAEPNITPGRSKHGKRASFGQVDRLNIDYYSDSDSDYDDAPYTQDGASEYTAPPTPGLSDGDETPTIKITLKNQDKFDDEACFSAPLLDMSKEWLHRAWREQYAEMLGCWGLISKRAEVLKFNGLISYFPPDRKRGGSITPSVHLALKTNSATNSGPTSAPMSRTSTLVPPAAQTFLRRSPTASPRYFSFNPEAEEFQPGTSFEPEIPAPPLDVLIPTEQYLRLSIPAPKPIEDQGFIGGFQFNSHSVESRLKPRPSLSRNTSRASGISLPGRIKKKDPIYTCGVCWIRVSGRFYLCPSCGHVAHFDCLAPTTLDEGLGWQEDDCVVGCGCGCGFENEVEQTEKGYMSGWDERGGWMPEVDEDKDSATIKGYDYEGGYGDGKGTWHEMAKREESKKKKKGKKES
ncbi:hypothetical protein P154DRAFT_518855 [Amniculicola lignicola CBS 123094]|uniref:WDR59/RTC1-like RING zinc finger domain-containing protein n=1 Tax=Amniculicola lignicola CBS 123094 TaxID=1392246 RepID=A0A6A5WU62_9PLEO|nr:hypothetical protein P154DRAFT_518855 [Amniculicola lignicola CBS 123094]